MMFFKNVMLALKGLLQWNLLGVGRRTSKSLGIFLSRGENGGKSWAHICCAIFPQPSLLTCAVTPGLIFPYTTVLSNKYIYYNFLVKNVINQINLNTSST